MGVLPFITAFVFNLYRDYIAFLRAGARGMFQIGKSSLAFTAPLDYHTCELKKADA